MVKSFATAQAAFDHLLDLYESQPARKTSILAEPDYATMDAEGEARFHEASKLAAASGAIRIEMRRRPDEHLIKALRLENPERLYAYTGRSRRGEEAKSAWARATADLKRQPEWLATETEKAIAAWSQHRSWRGLDMMDEHEAGLALKLAAALEEGAIPGTIHRVFSAAHSGDSKALRRTELVVSGILREALGMAPPAEGEEPLADFGIVAMPDPILLRGPFAAGTPPQALSAFHLYAAVTPPNAETIQWTGDAPYVLTIENKASFHEYVHKITDAGAVIFTGGFPSGPCIQLMKRIAGSRPDIPWYHWGDIDGGGLRIFRFLEVEVCRLHGIQLCPHLMDQVFAEAQGKPARAHLFGLKRIADSDCTIAALASWLAGPSGLVLEQELVRPRSPIANSSNR